MPESLSVQEVIRMQDKALAKKKKKKVGLGGKTH